MCVKEQKLVAKVTKWKSGAHDRFQCWDVYELWDNGQLTIDHFFEDEEWGATEESREIAETKNYSENFFKIGFHRVINHTGSVHEERL